MDVGSPYRSVIATVDGDVLIRLARTTKPRTGRELARLTDRSETGVRHSLERLVEQGLVVVTHTPGAHLFSLNRDHVAAPIVEEAAELRRALFDRMRDLIGSWSIAPVHASVFGSAARGEGDSSSDIDIFIVRPAGIDPDDGGWREQLNELSDSVYRWSGNHAGISEVSEQQAGHLTDDRPHVIEELLEDGIHMAGGEARALFGQMTL